MEDYLEDEAEIMNEREAESCISSDLFYSPICELDLEPAPIINDTDSIAVAIDKMKEKSVNSILVVNSEKLVGILSEHDIVRRAFGKGEIKVKEVMTKDPVSLLCTDMMAYVYHNMQVGGFRHIPIVDENMKPLHMVSSNDAISYILEFFPEEVSNLTDEPFRGEKVREGA